MNLNIKNTKDIEDISDFVASSINRELQAGKNVLWFVSGGSVIETEVLISKKIKESLASKLVITLADERYGEVGHPDSNWFILNNLGFNVKGAKLIPFLGNKDINETTIDMEEILKYELIKSDYNIGVFGIGADGHTAGILSKSKALNDLNFVCNYNTELYNRITVTPKVIYMLDEAILYAMGESKHLSLENLKKDLSIEEEPAQLLKKVPLLTIFTDYKF